MVEVLTCLKDWQQGEDRQQHTAKNVALEEAYKNQYLDEDGAGAPADQDSGGRLRGCLFSAFHYFLLAFRRSKNWMGPKARSWKHLSMSFSASRFWGYPTFGSPESLSTKVMKS
jgi:hypothetical protein